MDAVVSRPSAGGHSGTLAALRAAIEARAIGTHFQPQVCLRSGRILSFEALARWHDPQQGHVPPVVFIPLAEEAGLIDALTDAILEAALRARQGWHAGGFDLGVAVNVAPGCLATPGFASRVATLLRDTHTPPTPLNLEVTESGLMGQPEHVVEVLAELRSMGVELSLDDFGTWLLVAGPSRFAAAQRAQDRPRLRPGHAQRPRAGDGPGHRRARTAPGASRRGGGRGDRR
jgi:EAL domain-containing protein (putative c-di-GMP-specific phosphodiesterase class I)